MIPVYHPNNSSVLALAESLLGAEGIPYFVHNKHFGGLYPGVQLDLYNARTVMVPEADWLHAREALAPLLAAEPVSSPATSTSWRQRLRMLIELCFFSWFFPPRPQWKESKISEESNASIEGFSP